MTGYGRRASGQIEIDEAKSEKQPNGENKSADDGKHLERFIHGINAQNRRDGTLDIIPIALEQAGFAHLLIGSNGNVGDREIFFLPA